jgi:uncharacterized protein YraI
MTSPRQALQRFRHGSFVAAISIAALLALPAAAQADWGAIAVNPISGKTGISYDYGTATAAKNRARNECGRGKCRVAVWVRNGYAALVQKRSGAFVAGAGASRRRAFDKARHRAHEQAARSVTWVYSG